MARIHIEQTNMMIYIMQGSVSDVFKISRHTDTKEWLPTEEA